MKFTLHYRGELPSGNSRRTRKAKARIRSIVASQLEDLWNQVPLKHLRDKFLDPESELTAPITAVKKIKGQQFASVVNKNNHLVAELDILFLRPEEPGSLITQSGDVDNRIKTLLDALSIPKENQIDDQSDANGKLVHCLLEDDNLITGLNVSVNRLLDPKNKNEVLLVISVKVSFTEALISNLDFASS